MALIDELNLTINVDQERLKKIETDMKKLAAATNEVKDNINGLKSAIASLGAAMSKASPQRHARAQKELAGQTKTTTDTIQKEVKAAKELAKASEETAKSKEKAAAASKKQADAEEKAVKTAKKAKGEIGELEGSMKKFGNVTIPGITINLKDLDKKTATLFTTVTNLKKKLDSFRVASTFGTVGAVIAGIGGVVLGAGWRQGDITTGVKQGAYGYGGYGGAQTEELVAAAQDIGKKFRLVDPNQIANAVTALRHPRLGYTIDEVKKLTTLILNITGATGTDAGYLAAAVSQVLREYNINPADAETAILQMFDVARKTGVPTLTVAHYLNEMAPTARRTGTGYAEMLKRGGQAWYAGADASLVYGAIHREAQALTDEYKGRFQTSIETLRTNDWTNKEFKQAWFNLFRQHFPGLHGHPEIVDFLQALRTKQLWSHDMESLVQDFATRQGYGFAGLYAGSQTYRQQWDTLMADVFTNPNSSILSRFSDAELDAFNLMRDKLDESDEALSHIDVNVDEIAAMRKDTKNAWDRLIETIKEIFNPLIEAVNAIYRFIVPKGKREDIVRERLAEEAGLQGGEGKGFISRPYYLNEQTQGRLAKRIEEVYPHGTYKIEQMPASLIDMLLGRRRSYFVIDPVGKLIDEGMRESVNLAHYGGASAPVDVDQMGHGSGGTPQVTIEHLTVAQNVNSLAETQHNVAELSRVFAYGTGD